MKWLQHILLMGGVFGALSCSPVLQSSFLSQEHITYRSAEDSFTPGGRCNQPEDFAPDLRYPGHVPPIALRVNIHFMDSGPGVHNVSGERGRTYAHRLVVACNDRLRNNVQMFLPRGNQTPVIPVPWYYILAPDPDIPGHDGIYYHEDPELYYYIHGKNTNRGSREVINKYAVRPDSVLNIFLMPHHPDSVKSPTYKAASTGIMLGTGIKIAQVFTEVSPESFAGLVNHEIGHALGLSHTWSGNDGCEDTPANPNCWNYGNPPCDSLVSNNLMDYNAWQHAVTPCQIGRVLRNLTNLSSRVRKYARADWCNYDSSATITVSDSVHWKSPRDLSGDIVIAETGVLMLSCRLSMASGARIRVMPGGKLILDGCHIHNACGQDWMGIEVVGRKKVHGIVEITRPPQLENVMHSVDLSGH